jgi:hypothetical protein
MWIFLVLVTLVGGGTGHFQSNSLFATEQACKDFAPAGLVDVDRIARENKLEVEAVPVAQCVMLDPDDEDEDHGDPV